MRSGTWILVVCGTVGLAVSAGIAQDRLRENDRYSFNAQTPTQNVQSMLSSDRETRSESQETRSPFVSTSSLRADSGNSLSGQTTARTAGQTVVSTHEPLSPRSPLCPVSPTIIANSSEPIAPKAHRQPILLQKGNSTLCPVSIGDRHTLLSKRSRVGKTG